MTRTATLEAAHQVFLRACTSLQPAECSGQGAALRAVDADAWPVISRLAEQHGLLGLVVLSLDWAHQQTGVPIPILERMTGVVTLPGPACSAFVATLAPSMPPVIPGTTAGTWAAASNTWRTSHCARRTHFCRRATDNGFTIFDIVSRVFVVTSGAFALASVAINRPL